MKRFRAVIAAMLLITTAAAALSSCSGNNEGSTPDETDSGTVAVSETTPETSAPATEPVTSASEPTEAETVAETRDPDAVYEYETREIWCENNGNRIYGEAYIPISDTQTRFPLVIHAHGMGSNHEAGAGYGKRYAAKGFAAYTFDFPGGSRPTNENLSDGDMMNNSAVTEASDLQAILDTALTWDFVDTGNVFLEGGSMGGLVATMVGLDNTDTVKGMILHYPALYMPQGIIARYGSVDNVPDSLYFGEDYILGRRFATDLWDVDVVSRLGDFTGNVTIIQGSEDNLVSPSSIEEASGYFRNAEFHMIEGAGHGFSGDDFETAVQYGLDYLFANT